MALKLRIQTYKILTNDDEFCIPSLSYILLAKLKFFYLPSCCHIEIKFEIFVNADFIIEALFESKKMKKVIRVAKLQIALYTYQ